MGMKCSVDMLSMGLFPNAKEITESYSGMEATKLLPEYNLNNPNITCICVGDGHTPRTSATVCFRSAWKAICVDPLVKKLEWNVNRLTVIKDYIQNIKLTFDHPIIFLNIHSHAKLDQCLFSVSAPKIAVISMPCCVPQNLHIKPDVEYIDDNVWSPCNLIKVWYNVK